MFFVTATFGLIGGLALGMPLWAYLVWLVSLLFSKRTEQLSILAFGMFLCIAMGAPFFAYIIGFVCIVADLGWMESESKSPSFSSRW